MARCETAFRSPFGLWQGERSQAIIARRACGLRLCVRHEAWTACERRVRREAREILALDSVPCTQLNVRRYVSFVTIYADI